MKKRYQRGATWLIGGMMLLSLTACGYQTTAADQIGLHYDGGPFTSNHKFLGLLQPNTRKFYGPGDKVYFYPIGQRSFDATGSNGSERSAITSVSKDSVEMSTKVSITFSLKTSPDDLKAFHEKVGLKYRAYMDGDKISDGWKDVLNFYIGQSLETTLDRLEAQYNWRDLYNKPEIRVALQAEIDKELPDLVKQKIQGDYFDNFEAQVQKPDVTNDSLKQAIADAQNNVAQAQAQEAQAQAQLATAKAQLALQQVQARQKAAEIAGYGGIDGYLKWYCIDKGCNPYQPTYGGSTVTPTK